MKIKISDVKVSDRMRKFEMKKAQEIADSVKEIGLINPILVDKNYELIAGFHRLEAFKLLGLEEIEANVSSLEGLQRDLAEIDENLARSELGYIDRGEHLRRKKEIYEILHPEAKAGGDRKSEEFVSKRDDFSLVPSFAEDTARKTGLDKRTIQQDVQIVTALAPEVKEEIKVMDLPKTEALQLIRHVPKPEDQKRVLERIKDHKARGVRDAAAQLRIEEEVHKGKAIEVTIDAEFWKVGWKECVASIEEGSLGAIIAKVPEELSIADFQVVLDYSERLLKDTGNLVLQVGPEQIPALMKCTLPPNLIYRWTFANLLDSAGARSEDIRSSWVPVVVFVKSLTGSRQKVVGPDVIQKSFDPLTKKEDASLQIVTRFSRVGDRVLDPFVSLDLMSWVGAAVGRTFLGCSDDPATISRAKSKLEDVKGIIATL